VEITGKGVQQLAQECLSSCGAAAVTATARAALVDDKGHCVGEGFWPTTTSREVLSALDFGSGTAVLAASRSHGCRCGRDWAGRKAPVFEGEGVSECVSAIVRGNCATGGSRVDR
jgi:hypothetical protein